MNEALRRALKAVRPNAVTLVDAFEFPDNVLNSAIGRYDGRVYEALYEVRGKYRVRTAFTAPVHAMLWWVSRDVPRSRATVP